MASNPEKGRKNTAAKQLPSWLHPAVPTIRSYPKTAHQFKGVYHPPCSAPLFSFQAIVIITGVHTFHRIHLYYTRKCSRNQFRKISFAVFDVLEKRIAILTKVAILFLFLRQQQLILFPIDFCCICMYNTEEVNERCVHQ